MRPLEWLLLVSFIPVLVLPFVPQTWRRAWLFTAALLLLVGILQMIVEGWRVQMVPLYLLALLILAFRLPTLLGREGNIRRRRGILASALAALIIVGTGVVAGWALPVPTLPQPTGPYAVGVVDREVMDAARQRRLMVSVWYPAAQRGTPAPLMTSPDAIADALASSVGLPGFVLQHLRYFTVAASTNAPVLADETPFPVLVFSHGLVGLRMQSSTILQELASWGYVVVAIDHTDAAAVTVFPDGETRLFDLARFGITAADDGQHRAAVNDLLFPVWVADQRFIYDTLEDWALNDPLLAGRLDLSRIGSLGHSFGGATALEVCRVDARCLAAVNMDGALYGDMLSLPAVRPLLLISADESNDYTEAIQAWERAVAMTTADAYWLELPGSNHLSFTLSHLITPVLAPPGFDTRAGLSVIERYLRAFFDVYLRGDDVQRLAQTGDDSVRWIAHPLN